MGVGDAVYHPAEAVAIGIAEGGLVADAAVMAAVAVYGAVLCGYFPVIFRGVVALADYLTETAFHHRVEALVGFPADFFRPAVGAVAEGLAFEKVAFRLVVLAEARHAPACLYVDALYGQAPAVAGETAAAVTAILQGCACRDASAAFGCGEGIAECGCAVLVGRRCLCLLYACHGVGGLEVADASGDVAGGLRALRYLYDAVDDVGEVCGLGGHCGKETVGILVPEHGPASVLLVVVVCVYVGCGVALWYQRAVIRHGDGGGQVAEVLAVGQEAVA